MNGLVIHQGLFAPKKNLGTWQGLLYVHFKPLIKITFYSQFFAHFSNMFKTLYRAVLFSVFCIPCSTWGGGLGRPKNTSHSHLSSNWEPFSQWFSLVARVWKTLATTLSHCAKCSTPGASCLQIDSPSVSDSALWHKFKESPGILATTLSHYDAKYFTPGLVPKCLNPTAVPPKFTMSGLWR